MRPTPGPGGYLLMWLVSVLAFTAGLVLPDPGSSFPALLGWMVYGSFFVAIFSIPFAVVGTLVLHAVCRRVPEQWAHVVVAFLVGGAAGVVAGAWLFEDEWLRITLTLAVAVALGRLAVVPLVPRVRT